MEKSSNDKAPTAQQDKQEVPESPLMPTFFLCHGSPFLILEKSKQTAFLQALPSTFPKPKAIVIISAHYESKTQLITSNNGTYETVYDFYGFPKEMYQVTYPAKGDSILSKEIQDLLKTKGIESSLDKERGLDHGVWPLLRLMYPEKDIPIVAMSIDAFQKPEEIYKIGVALAPLREKGVLIIGSGSSVHNLRMMGDDGDEPEKWAVEFDDWIIKNIQEWNLEELFEYMKKAPSAKLAVPRAEHFNPIWIALGAASDTRKPNVVFRDYQWGSFSHTSIRFD